MKCYNHPEIEAVGVCTLCKRAVCSECGIEVQGKLVCRECLAAGKTGVQASDITDNDKMMALLSYVISLIALIILLSESGKQRRFQRYHAVHALSMFVALWLVIFLVGCLVSVVTLGVGSFLLPFFGLLYYVPMIYYGVQAYQGKYVNVPLVTDFVRGQGWV